MSKSKKETKSVHLGVRLSKLESLKLQLEAETQKVSMSQLIRTKLSK